MSTAAVADVFEAALPVDELVVLVLSYATRHEAMRFCDEWDIPNVIKTLAWPTYAAVGSLGDLSVEGSGFTATIAAEGNLELLKWARAKGCEWDKLVCQYAARNGDLKMLQWARTNGCEWETCTSYGGARNGHLHVLQWARANGCPWNVWTCSHAAYAGHLHVLQWLRANGCPWNVDICSYAAMRGHLHVLQWARANGCPWDKWTCRLAFENHQWEVLRWLIDNGYEHTSEHLQRLQELQTTHPAASQRC